MRPSRLLRIALILALCTAFVVPSAAYAYSSKDVAAHKAAAEAARKKAAAEQARAKALLGETERLESKISAIEAELEKLGTEIGTAAQRRAGLDSQIELLRAEISAKESLIAGLRLDYEVRSEALGARVDAAYRTGDWAYVEMLLSSENLVDLIRRTEFLTILIQDDEAAAAELDASRLALETANAEMARALETIQVKRAEARAEEQGLRTLQSARDDKRAAEQSAQDQKAALLAQTKKNIARLKAMALAEEQESARIAQILKGGSSHGTGAYAGTLSWPAPGHTRVSSNFGYRIHPILHIRKMHTGIDVSAPSGSRLVASGNGTVIFAGYNGGYGNCTMIDHGNGLVTLYAHQKRITVRKGTRVSAGSTIGYVGSTGLSTGPHLHFEVRVNGTPKNPLSYL